ncbi:MAG: hypothetical protein LBF41_09015 [Deltaproteobacteria bacterium]|jgi:hypothetical protein|nr:hypothetical protein [Deltaproteobacteria bacterium]
MLDRLTQSSSVPVLCLALSLALFLAAAAPLFAAPDGEPAGASAEVAKMALAAKLLDEGRATKSPILLAAAAELMSGVSTKEGKLSKTVEGGDDSAVPPASAEGPFRLDPGGIYDEAISLAEAQGNQTMSNLITGMKAKRGSRQSTYAAIEHTDRLKPNSADVYTHSFKAREQATVLVVADGDNDIDLEIYDTKNAIVVGDRDSTSVGSCNWVPGETQDYKIKVINNTETWVDYLLFSN